MRRKLIVRRAAPILAALLIAAGGCSSSAPPPGPNGPGDDSAASSLTAASSAAATELGKTGATGTTLQPETTGATGSAAESLSGLSAECQSAIAAQLAIVQLFGRPIGGHQLTDKDVSTVFDAIGTGMPSGLDDDVTTLHDAAKRSVGKSSVAVAAILAEKKVSDALSAMSDFVKGCSPPTS